MCEITKKSKALILSVLNQPQYPDPVQVVLLLCCSHDAHLLMRTLSSCNAFQPATLSLPPSQLWGKKSPRAEKQSQDCRLISVQKYFHFTFLHPLLIGDQHPQACLDPRALSLLVSLASCTRSSFNIQSALLHRLVAYSSLSPGTHGRHTFLGLSSPDRSLN